MSFLNLTLISSRINIVESTNQTNVRYNGKNNYFTLLRDYINLLHKG